MAEVTYRMLNLLSALQTGQMFTGEELARRLEVSPRTVRRDVDRLRRYGYPVITQPGPGGHYRLAAGQRMPPLVLGDDEALAIMVALAGLAGNATAAAGGIDEAAARAYGKVDQFLPRRLRPRLRSVRESIETSPQHSPDVDADLLAMTAEATAGKRIIRFGYVDRAGRQTERRVEPYRQVNHLLRWYLLAWDLGRDDWRVFRLDRMTGVAPTGQVFAGRELPADSATEYLRSGFAHDKRHIEVLVHTSATKVFDSLRHQDADVVALDDGRTRVTIPVDGWQWLVLALAFLDADFTIDDPEMAARCRDFGERLISGGSPTGTSR